MLKYKNIIFDFGNVLAQFNEEKLLRQFAPSEDAMLPMKEAIFYNWAELDKGTIDYDTYVKEAIRLAPSELESSILHFFDEWMLCLTPLTETWDFIKQLKNDGAKLYVFSNAPIPFAESSSHYEIVKEFDGLLFSAPYKMAKPEPVFYHKLFDTWNLNPSECFFLDDKKENIDAGIQLGMQGLVFKNNIEEARSLIYDCN